MEIIVVRNSADKEGDDIVDPLMATVLVALSRGRAELDERAHSPQTVSLGIVFMPSIRHGQLVEVHDAAQGVSWRGKIIGVTHNATGGTAPSADTVLDIQRPTDFYE